MCRDSWSRSAVDKCIAQNIDNVEIDGSRGLKTDRAWAVLSYSIRMAKRFFKALRCECLILRIPCRQIAT